MKPTPLSPGDLPPRLHGPLCVISILPAKSSGLTTSVRSRSIAALPCGCRTLGPAASPRQADGRCGAGKPPSRRAGNHEPRCAAGHEPEHQGQRSFLYMPKLLPVAQIRTLRFKVLAEPLAILGSASLMSRSSSPFRSSSPKSFASPTQSVSHPFSFNDSGASRRGRSGRCASSSLRSISRADLSPVLPEAAAETAGSGPLLSVRPNAPHAARSRPAPFLQAIPHCP